MVGSLGLNWTHRQSLYATMPLLPEKGPERDRGNSPGRGFGRESGVHFRVSIAKIKRHSLIIL
jgi:hypothetical protein